MPKRYLRALASVHRAPLFQGIALLKVLQEGYSLKQFRLDLFAGLTVAVVALPLVMAFAIASGVDPQYGIYTAVVTAGIIPFFSGSRVVITGPTASFVALLAPIAATHGLGGLLIASFMAGIILIVMGLCRFGRLIQFIPYPVTTGFTAGIAVVIITLNLKDFVGIVMAEPAPYFVDKVLLLVRHADQVRWQDCLIGSFTLAALFLIPRVTRRVPTALLAMALATGFMLLMQALVPGFSVETIGSRYTFESGGVTYHGIAPIPPTPALPWSYLGGDGAPLGITFGLVRELLPSAIAIAMLSAIVSLLCAVVADGMSATKHDPDTELCALGIGNIVGSFFGAIPASGAIARTAANVRAGGRTPISAIVHALAILLALLVMAPVLGHLPLAALAALLVYVAWNMLDTKHIGHMLKVSPRGDLMVLLVCFGLTVMFDMVMAVSVGVGLAAILFIGRMSEMTSTRLLDETIDSIVGPIPEGVIVYEIAGPLFFGAAERAINSLHGFTFQEPHKAIILHLAGVPHIDVTGLVAFESILLKLRQSKTFVVLSGVQSQPAAVMKNAGIVNEPNVLAFCYDVEQALMLASMAGGRSSVARL